MHLLPEDTSWLWPRPEAALFYSTEQRPSDGAAQDGRGGWKHAGEQQTAFQ